MMSKTHPKQTASKTTRRMKDEEKEEVSPVIYLSSYLQIYSFVCNYFYYYFVFHEMKVALTEEATMMKTMMSCFGL